MRRGPRAAPPTGPNPLPQPRGGVPRFVLVILAWLGVCWTTLGLLFAPVVAGGWGTIVLAALATTAPVAALLWRGRKRAYPGAAFRLLVLRPFWYAQLLLPVVTIAGTIGAIGGVAFGNAGDGGRAGVIVVALLFAGLMAAGWVGSRRLVVRQLEATWPDLPPGLDGMRIAQISDTHVGPHTSRHHLRRVAAAVRAAEADLVAVTGDLVDDHAPDVDHYAAALGALAAPLGVYAVAGNHDVYAGWAAVHERLRMLPLTVLVNEAVLLERGGSRFALAGTGDPAGRRAASAVAPDIPATLRAIPPGTFTIAMAHNPALWPELAKQGVALTLSGHTHHGQFALPSFGWSLATPFLQYAMGMHREAASLLYIHPGTNFWGIPFRIGARPEVAVITLRRGDAVGIASRRAR